MVAILFGFIVCSLKSDYLCKKFYLVVSFLFAIFAKNYITYMAKKEKRQSIINAKPFQKKTQKTPQGEIEKALKIKEAYYADKQS